jgi:glucose-6-phosphate 1-dehydrogenase
VSGDHAALRRLVILGASGDLTSRLLLPALAALVAHGSAPPGLAVVGVAREDWDDGRFRGHCERALDRFAGSVDPAARRTVLRSLTYARADVTDADQLAAAVGTQPCAVYLALPNTVFAPTCRALRDVGLADGSVLVVEKPFGTGLADARSLNALVTQVVPEERVFRVDHFLAKQTVVNVLGLRFANRVFEPVWNAVHIASVDVVFDETLGLEGRVGYYDRAGALRDMLQNHLLQVLALVAMEPPTSTRARDLRDRRVDALRAVSVHDPDSAGSSVRARYTAGSVDGRPLPAYADEPGVDPALGTETYAEVLLDVDNWRWAGVPFRLRSGKALARGRQEVVVTFRPVPHLPFPSSEPVRPNTLRLSLKPDRVALELNVNGPGDPFELDPAELALELPDHELTPYPGTTVDLGASC